MKKIFWACVYITAAAASLWGHSTDDAAPRPVLIASLPLAANTGRIHGFPVVYSYYIARRRCMADIVAEVRHIAEECGFSHIGDLMVDTINVRV